MNSLRASRLGLLLLLAALAACGKSGERERRPIEKIFWVTGATGSKFRIHGIEADNARHLFRDQATGEPRVLTAPYLVVLENAEPPVLGRFEALDPEMAVTLAIGQIPVEQPRPLPVGQIVTVTSDDQKVPRGARRGPEVRIEVTSAEGSVAANIAFDATLGDLENTDLTSCVIGEPGVPIFNPSCFTPTTFFIEEAEDFVSGIFDERETPNSSLRAELYVDGDLKDSETDGSVAVVQSDL